MGSRFLLLLSIFLYLSCSSSNNKTSEEKSKTTNDALGFVEAASEKAIIPDTSFVNIKNLSDKFNFDMRYATANNFLKELVYDCDNCLMRYEVAKAIILVNDSLLKTGYRISFFDCFRPVEVQKKMWTIVPDARYVANPYKTGSVHNKGAALDLTLITLDGATVDMGTDFDHFGEEAHHAYTELSAEVLQNRKRLKGVMEHFGFTPIRTEWWHYNFGESSKYAISNQALCE